MNVKIYIVHDVCDNNWYRLFLKFKMIKIEKLKFV